MFAWHAFAEPAQEAAGASATEVIVVKPGEFDALLARAPRQPDDLDRDASDTAVILYTSGTTGTPKGAELTHTNMLENCRAFGTDLMHITEHDVIFGALPLFHSFGQTCCLNSGIQAGACLTMITRFEPGKALEIDVARRRQASIPRREGCPAIAKESGPTGR